MRRRRGERDQGAVLVELALVLPFLVLLVLAVVDFGSGWRNSNVLSASLRSAGRVATQSMTNAQADRYALEAYVGSMSQGRNLTTEKVIVYEVDEGANPSGSVPSQCLDAPTAGNPPYGVDGLCNVYLPDQLEPGNLAAANFGCGSSAYDRYFCPTEDRVNTLPGTPTTVGVYAEVSYQYLTGLVPGGTTTFTDKSVARVEPSPT